MAEILFKEESYKIIGACMAVYNEMGFGFLEAVYQPGLFTTTGVDSTSGQQEQRKN